MNDQDANFVTNKCKLCDKQTGCKLFDTQTSVNFVMYDQSKLCNELTNEQDANLVMYERVQTL